MHSLITSYLLQSKQCILPGIGLLKIIHTPASPDDSNTKILPPFDGIIFKKENHSKSPGLVKYISGINNISIKEAEDQLSNFCNEWRRRINAGEKLHFETIGSIHKNGGGVISFEGEPGFNYLQPVPLLNNRIKIEKAVTGDHVLGFPVAKEVREQIIKERSYWGLWALILLVIGCAMIFYHFFAHELSGSATGNQYRITIDSAAATYTIPK